MHSFAEWAEIVSVLIEELRLSQFDVLGSSSGAPYSYAIGQGLPDKVRNTYIFSGIPALYHPEVRAHWPYEMKPDASLAELKVVARELFFSQVSKADLKKSDIRDSKRNNCFGVAQDLRLRGRDWGFRLQDLRGIVYMRHSKEDEAVPLITAQLTSKLLPNCVLDIEQHGGHFSVEAFDDFIKAVIAGKFEREEPEISAPS
jgi:pimeloyl-ACP methyl ester carboxylesterase